eukprot:SRR837773.6388.p2 GENE.SRR837773.6388~~SRR837773.6388.p2  ORF type:complete len:177 (-),score=60.16 SRR837773.6388:48-545(-)
MKARLAISLLLATGAWSGCLADAGAKRGTARRLLSLARELAEPDVASTPAALTASESTLDQVATEAPRVQAEAGEEPMLEPLPKYSEQEIEELQQTYQQAAKDCLLSDWTAWSECREQEGSGQVAARQGRHREVLQPQQQGGKPCDIAEEFRTCENHGVISKVNE